MTYIRELILDLCYAVRVAAKTFSNERRWKRQGPDF